MGPQPIVPPAEMLSCASIADVAEETLRDACIPETIAALVARASAAGARDPVVASALSRIADHEERHAELAWAIAAWAVRDGRDPVRERVARVARAGQIDDAVQADAGAERDLTIHGILPRAEQRAIARRVIADVIVPCLQALEARTEPRVGARA